MTKKQPVAVYGLVVNSYDIVRPAKYSKPVSDIWLTAMVYDGTTAVLCLAIGTCSSSSMQMDR